MTRKYSRSKIIPFHMTVVLKKKMLEQYFDWRNHLAEHMLLWECSWNAPVQQQKRSAAASSKRSVALRYRTHSCALPSSLAARAAALEGRWDAGSWTIWRRRASSTALFIAGAARPFCRTSLSRATSAAGHSHPRRRLRVRTTGRDLIINEMLNYFPSKSISAYLQLW